MSKEIWKNIKGFKSYQISNFGRVKSFKGCTPILVGGSLWGEYRAVKLYINGKFTRQKISRLVAQHFLKPVKNKKLVNHKNGIKTDDRAVNLEWCTAKENMQHASKSGLMASGERQGSSKLTKKDVLKIRKNKTNKSQRELAKIFNVSQAQIQRIIVRKSWQHI